MTDRCTGHCCHAFVLPLSATEIQRSLACARGEAGCWIDDEGKSHYGSHTDIETIASMVEPISEDDPAIPPHLRLGTRPPGFYMFRCKNVLPNGDCGIYETRPGMCRDYPYNMPCRYAACTWEAGRTGRHPPLVTELVQLTRARPA